MMIAEKREALARREALIEQKEKELKEKESKLGREETEEERLERQANSAHGKQKTELERKLDEQQKVIEALTDQIAKLNKDIEALNIPDLLKENPVAEHEPGFFDLDVENSEGEN